MNGDLGRKLRMGLIGGGGQAFIGGVHSIAATLDHRAELVAGALSSDPDRARAAAPAFGIAPQRAYVSYQELLEREQALDEDQRIDFVSIATPNHTHFEIARACLAAGLHVVCDKPLTIDLDQAIQLQQQVRSSGRVLVLTHNYTGYPMVRQAREMIRQGELGSIRAVRIHYLQGWLRGMTPGKAPERGGWKADPARAGPSGTMADVGTHSFNLLRFVTGLKPESLACRMRTYQPERELDDYGHVVLELGAGALGTITVSQVTHGRANDLAMEVDGDRGTLAWRQEQPNYLDVYRQGQPRQVYERHPAGSYLQAASRQATRLPPGHPEGFYEAFANVYTAGFDHMLARMQGREMDDPLHPTVDDGVEGVRFVERCLASHRAGGGDVAFADNTT